MFLIQLSVVLADKIDTTMLGLAIQRSSRQDLSVYSVVSKPFGQIRQVGWMLASLVMPAVASLAAARDERRAGPGQVRRSPTPHRHFAAGRAARLDLRRTLLDALGR